MFKKFNSIEQFRSVVKHVKDNCEYHNEHLPVIDFYGTVKLHGTNSAICQDTDGSIFFQSRSRVITTTDDNAGFVNDFTGKIDYLNEMFNDIRKTFKGEYYNTRYDSLDPVVYVYGEYCGGNIQKNIGLNKLSKRFVVFSVDFVFPELDEVVNFSGECLNILSDLNDNDHGIFWISDYENFSVKIDFAEPEKSVEILQKLTDDVEKECPVAKAMGAEGELVGEGIVWRGLYKNSELIFKTKGEKHKNEKANKRKTVTVDPEVFAKVNDFVNDAVTSRVEQAIECVFTQNNQEPDRKGTGAFLSWIANDIIKEESDVIESNNFDEKIVKKQISVVAREWFFERY